MLLGDGLGLMGRFALRRWYGNEQIRARARVRATLGLGLGLKLGLELGLGFTFLC